MATKDPQRNLEVLIAQGLSHHRSGNFKAAKATYSEVLKMNPENADALHLLGCLYDDQGNTKEAIKLLTRAAKSNPKAHAYAYNLANMHFKQGNFAESARCYREAIRIKPDYAAAHNNLGQVLVQVGQRGEAKVCFQNAILHKATYADPHYNLGIELKVEGNLEGAVAEFLTAIRIQPTFADAHCNLGGTYLQLQRISLAVSAYERALELEPRNSRHHTNLGGAVLRMGRQQDAIASFRTALRLDPGDAYTHSNLILAMSYASPDKRTLQLQCEEWEQSHGAPLRASFKRHANLVNPEKRIRVGFISADYRNHAAAYWIEPVLSNFRNEEFEVFCYSSNAVVDATTERMKLCTDKWIECAAMSDDTLAQRIRQDAIDILVDLSSHTEGHRLLVFARQPAPIQVSWFGLPFSTGLKTIQYRLTDNTVDPLDSTESFESEKLVRLDRFYAAYRPEPMAPPVGDSPFSHNNCITFASFNSFAKISSSMLQLWVDILHQVPNSRLIILSAGLEDADIAAHIHQIFAAHGVSVDRVLLRGWTPMSDFLHLGHEADIALDPFPFNGGVTTCHALWMGLPVITLNGQSAASRVGDSILSQLDLSDLVANEPSEYKMIAVSLAQDPNRLASLRASLRKRMKSGGLLDGASLCEKVRVAFREMWRNGCTEGMQNR